LAIKIDRLAEWIKEKGYQTSGPSIEVYSKKPKVVDGVSIHYGST
jgi:effector-binding domain-containing protein